MIFEHFQTIRLKWLQLRRLRGTLTPHVWNTSQWLSEPRFSSSVCRICQMWIPCTSTLWSGSWGFLWVALPTQRKQVKTRPSIIDLWHWRTCKGLVFLTSGYQPFCLQGHFPLPITIFKGPIAFPVICYFLDMDKSFICILLFLLLKSFFVLFIHNTHFTFTHLTDAFIQSDLQCIQAIHLYCQYVCSLGIEPTTFALLTQCSNHRNTF